MHRFMLTSMLEKAAETKRAVLQHVLQHIALHMVKDNATALCLEVDGTCHDIVFQRNAPALCLHMPIMTFSMYAKG